MARGECQHHLDHRNDQGKTAQHHMSIKSPKVARESQTGQQRLEKNGQGLADDGGAESGTDSGSWIPLDAKHHKSKSTQNTPL